MKIRINAATGGGASPLRRTLAALSLGVLVPLAGCDINRLMNVDDVDVTGPDFVVDSAAINVVYGGAIGDFQLGYVGSGATGGGQTGEGIVLISAMFSDEAYSAGTFGTRRDVSRRNIDLSGAHGTSTNTNLIFAERWLHRAGRGTENAVEAFQAAGLGGDRRVAEMLALAGYTYVFFAENYCSGVPFSESPRVGFAPEYGSPLQTNQILDRAIARFDAALAAPGAQARERNLATLGKARALLNKDDVSGAAALAREIPTGYGTDVGFNYVVFHSEASARQQNPVFHFGPDQGRYGVPNRLGVNGIRWLEHAAGGDPRVRTHVRDAFDSPLGLRHVPQKYERTTNTPLATWIEAQLIVAEAELHADNFAGAGGTLAILNALRAEIELDPLTDPVDPAARVDLLFEERALWLWLTAHRLGDMRRLVRQYGRSVDDVYPVGFHGYYDANGDFFPGGGGGSFGTQVSLPLHLDETNNPNFQGGCNPTEV
jgi:starch-binding outer membrane protein, SusD/RagB family